MAMKVQNNNNQGNPYHDDEGKFTTPGDSGSGATEETSSYSVGSQDPSLDDFMNAIKGGDDDDYSLDDVLDDILDEERNKNKKPVEEMSETELLQEIQECQEKLASVGMDTYGFDSAFGDRRLKCKNYRRLAELIDKYDIDFSNCITESGYPANSSMSAYVGLSYMLTNVSVVPSYTPNGTPNYTVNMAEFGGLDYNCVLYLNKDRYTSSQVCAEVERRSEESNWHTKAAPDNYDLHTLTHENGHALQNTIFAREGLWDEVFKKVNEQMKEYAEKKGSLFKTKSRSWDAYANIEGRVSKKFSHFFEEAAEEYRTKQKNEILEIYKKKFGKTDEDFLNESSRYGNKNSAEWFAETFASLNCGMPTDSALAMKDWLRKKGYMR